MSLRSVFRVVLSYHVSLRSVFRVVMSYHVSLRSVFRVVLPYHVSLRSVFRVVRYNFQIKRWSLPPVFCERDHVLFMLFVLVCV